jgi:hypothetical protein
MLMVLIMLLMMLTAPPDTGVDCVEKGPAEGCRQQGDQGDYLGRSYR